ncbi:putative Ig domain-containing protein [Sinosporangium siamense]|uniref:Uncharacterized protein n=1 Tax=Sinosporangium siamense TaxID=1367973 RepID=A0A919RMP5_9ACTN|nr:putative Ig domain-containing protein [Sinosporangium siamense]GII94824.1 hypothetical protein Ssi02_50550 [Sinosporangium siamense]
MASIAGAAGFAALPAHAEQRSVPGAAPRGVKLHTLFAGSASEQLACAHSLGKSMVVTRWSGAAIGADGRAYDVDVSSARPQQAPGADLAPQWDLEQSESGERADRVEGADRGERADRVERAEKAEGVDRGERGEKAEGADRIERAEKPERTEEAGRVERAHVPPPLFNDRAAQVRLDEHRWTLDDTLDSAKDDDRDVAAQAGADPLPSAAEELQAEADDRKPSLTSDVADLTSGKPLTAGKPPTSGKPSTAGKPLTSGKPLTAGKPSAKKPPAKKPRSASTALLGQGDRAQGQVFAPQADEFAGDVKPETPAEGAVKSPEIAVADGVESAAEKPAKGRFAVAPLEYAGETGTPLKGLIGVTGGRDDALVTVTVSDLAALPDGVVVGPDGRLSGTPTQAGTFEVPVKVCAAGACRYAIVTFTIAEGAGPMVAGAAPEADPLGPVEIAEPVPAAPAVSPQRPEEAAGTARPGESGVVIGSLLDLALSLSSSGPSIAQAHLKGLEQVFKKWLAQGKPKMLWFGPGQLLVSSTKGDGTYTIKVTDGKGGLAVLNVSVNPRVPEGGRFFTWPRHFPLK